MYLQMSKNLSTKVIFSHILDYGSVIRSAASGTNIERLNKLQKRVARIILHANYGTPSVDMFTDLGWLSVPGRLNLDKALLTYYVA